MIRYISKEAKVYIYVRNSRREKRESKRGRGEESTNIYKKNEVSKQGWGSRVDMTLSVVKKPINNTSNNNNNNKINTYIYRLPQ